MNDIRVFFIRSQEYQFTKLMMMPTWIKTLSLGTFEAEIGKIYNAT